MLAGRVMYRDLYDHKGPLIYALHALCALVCPADFTGVWVLEILFAAVFLLEGYQAVKAMAGRRYLLLQERIYGSPATDSIPHIRIKGKGLPQKEIHCVPYVPMYGLTPFLPV